MPFGCLEVIELHGFRLPLSPYCLLFLLYRAILCVILHTADSKAVCCDIIHLGDSLRRKNEKAGIIVMTKQEARKYFGLGENDKIDRDGVLRLKKNAEEQLKAWSLTRFHREKIEKELEALKALLTQ